MQVALACVLPAFWISPFADEHRYEVDARQIPANWTSGYFLFGTSEPGEPAKKLYGTEVFEVGVANNARDEDTD